MQAKLIFLDKTVLPVIQSQHWSLCNVTDGVAKDLADIEQSLDNIWNTEIGSDILRPDFGCNWHRYIDYPIDEAPLLIIRELTIAAQKWEPRIVIKSIAYLTDVEKISFRTNYKLNKEIAGSLNDEYQSIIEGSLSGGRSYVGNR